MKNGLLFALLFATVSVLLPNLMYLPAAETPVLPFQKKWVSPALPSNTPDLMLAVEKEKYGVAWLLMVLVPLILPQAKTIARGVLVLTTTPP